MRRAAQPLDIARRGACFYLRDKHRPFFEFLDTIPGINWISDIQAVNIEGRPVLMLPHTRTPAEDWASLHLGFAPDYIFCHQTFNGANAGTFKMTASVGPKYFQETHGYRGKVISGDIHVPQTIGPLTYVGSPYPVAFGDSFDPRFLRIDSDGVSEIPLESIRKVSADIFSADDVPDLGLKEGDQAKLRVYLNRSEFPMWEQHRDAVIFAVEQAGATAHAIELKELVAVAGKEDYVPFERAVQPPELLDRFCKHAGVYPEARIVGKTILESLDGSD